MEDEFDKLATLFEEAAFTHWPFGDPGFGEDCPNPSGVMGNIVLQRMGVDCLFTDDNRANINQFMLYLNMKLLQRVEILEHKVRSEPGEQP